MFATWAVVYVENLRNEPAFFKFCTSIVVCTMLGTVLRTRVVSLPGSARSITRFISALSVPSRAPPRSITRAFTSSQISREYGYGDRRGDSEGRSGESAYVQQPRPPKNPPSQTLWIGNLPFAAVSQQVADLFSDFGTVTSVRIGAFCPVPYSWGLIVCVYRHLSYWRIQGIRPC